MRRLQIFLHSLFTSFWLLPALLVLGAIIMSWLLLDYDSAHSWEIERSFFGLFGGQADAARQLLAAIAGSLITVISISFSITILALQQVATQYSPRVLRNFTADRVNQLVLGSYLATFIYTLLTLRAIRSGENGAEQFVPALSITFGFVLTLSCIGLLIFFISHISTTLQVENIVRRIHTDLMEQLDDLFPEQIGEAAEELATGREVFQELAEGQVTLTVPNNCSGFVQTVDEAPLADFRDPMVTAVFVMPQVGDFLLEGEVVMTLITKGPPDADQRRRLLKALVVGRQRSIYQDPLFAVDQLVDIALRALSSGINDPATAMNVLYQLTHALSRLATRKFPDVRRTFPESEVVFVFNAPDWERYVETAYDQIRRAGADQVGLMVVFIQQLHRLLFFTPTTSRKQPVVKQIMNIKQQVLGQDLPEVDRQKLLTQIETALADAPR